MFPLKYLEMAILGGILGILYPLWFNGEYMFIYIVYVRFTCSYHIADLWNITSHRRVIPTTELDDTLDWSIYPLVNVYITMGNHHCS